MTPLSDDPDVRARQVANLEPGRGQARPGEARALTHGLRRREPMALLLADDLARELLDSLLEALPTRRPDGTVSEADARACEAAAVQGTIVLRAARYFAEHPENLAGLAMWSTATERYGRMLDRLGVTPAARARLGLDIAQTESATRRLAEAGGGDVIEGGAS